VTSSPPSGKNCSDASLQKVLEGIKAQQNSLNKQRNSLNEQQKKLSEWREQVLAQLSASRQGMKHDDSCMNTSGQQTPARNQSAAQTSPSVDSNVPLNQVMGSPGLSSITHSRGRLAGKKDSSKKKQPSTGKSPNCDTFAENPSGSVPKEETGRKNESSTTSSLSSVAQDLPDHRRGAKQWQWIKKCIKALLCKWQRPQNNPVVESSQENGTSTEGDSSHGNGDSPLGSNEAGGNESTTTTGVVAEVSTAVMAWGESSAMSTAAGAGDESS